MLKVLAVNKEFWGNLPVVVEVFSYPGPLPFAMFYLYLGFCVRSINN